MCLGRIKILYWGEMTMDYHNETSVNTKTWGNMSLNDHEGR